MKIKRALLSVSDKKNIVEFAEGLSALGVEIISTGGTAKLLSGSGIKVKEVSDVTGFPEMMEGRVKTLHPKIHGGILAVRKKEEHLKQAEKEGIGLIDMVVVNLYPFEETVLKEKVKLEDAIEQIDIGGPTLLRSAAKNFEGVAVVCNPERYGDILEEMKKGLSDETRKMLALETFEHVAHYDVVIAQYLRKEFEKNEEFPEYLNLSFKKIQDLRYGENPHQKAALYRDRRIKDPSAVNSVQIQGKQLSYNNILDANAAFELLKEFDEPTAVIVKHNNPCGVASSPDILEAYRKAKSVDPEAAFGSIVAINQKVGKELAEEITSTFVEVLIVPKIDDEAREILSKKKSLRVLETGESRIQRKKYIEYRSVVGGLLVQDSDYKLQREVQFVTKRKPTKEEMKSLLYAWTIAKYVKSNAIVFAREHRAAGIGAGQMKRVDAAKLAALIASDFGESLKGCGMASDAFFPFRDGIDYAAKLGVTAIIQPGGSIRDREVIAAAEEHDIAMVFTGIRHFRH